jgi:hypothetical protein
MSTKSREVIWGGRIRGAKIRAEGGGRHHPLLERSAIAQGAGFAHQQQ